MGNIFVIWGSAQCHSSGVHGMICKKDVVVGQWCVGVSLEVKFRLL